MQAYKCDICTAFFTKQSATVIRIADDRYSCITNEDGWPIDICPSCAEAIQKAIDDRRTIGGTRDGTENA